LIALLPFVLWASGEFSFRVFTPEDGLSHNTVHATVQDAAGTLWLGTYESIERFDGTTFVDPLRTAGFTVNRARHVMADPEGGVWFATHTGAVHIDGDRITHFSRVDGLLDDSIYCTLRDRNGHLWIAGAGGLQRMLPDGTLEAIAMQGLPDRHVRAMLEDRAGTLWLGTLGGPARFDGNSFVPIALPVAAQPGVYGLAADARGRLWLATDNGLFCQGGARILHFDRRHGLPSDSVWAVHPDRHGILWAGTDAGLARVDLDRFDTESLVFERPGTDEITRTTIYSIDEDREGSLWFGTCIGLYQLHEPNLQNHELLETGVGSMVLSVARDREDRLWLGTDRGVAVREHGTLKNVTAELALADLFVRVVVPDGDGGLYLGTRRGLHYHHPHRSARWDRQTGMQDEHILSAHLSEDGTLFVGTLRGGLMALDRNQTRWIDTSDGLSDNRVYALTGDGAGGVWVGTGKGLDHLHEGRVQGVSGALPGKEVSALHRDRSGRLWIGTNRGLASLFEGELTRHAGPETAIRFLTQDALGAIWVGTVAGFWRYREGTRQHFDGAAWTPREMNFGAVGEDSEGLLWFGHFDGVVSVDPFRLPPEEATPPVQLTGLDILGKPATVADGLSLPYNRNQISVRFSSLSYRAPEQMVYEVRLEGQDRQWQRAEGHRVSYADLSPGAYRLVVRARDRNGRPSEEPASLRFTIEPPFWQSTPFRVLVILVILGVFASLLQNLRLRNRVLAQETENLAARVSREQAAKLQRDAELQLLHAQMNPHFLQNAFTSALYFVLSSIPSHH